MNREELHDDIKEISTGIILKVLRTTRIICIYLIGIHIFYIISDNKISYMMIKIDL